MVINENLEKVLDANDLLWAELKMLVACTGKVIAVSCVVNHCLDDAERDIWDILHCYHSIVVFASLNHLDVLACSSWSLLVLALFEKFWTVHLQQVDFLPYVINARINHD